MPPFALPDSDSDHGTPEVVTLASSKKASRTQDNAVHAAELARKTKLKRENQERDRALKKAKMEREREKEIQEERAQKLAKRKAKRKGKMREEGVDAKEPFDPLEERMRRAMKEAEEEDMADEMAEDMAEVDSDEEEGEGEGEEGSILESEETEKPVTSKHLPDHLFTMAAASLHKPSQTTSKLLPKPSKSKPKNKKARRTGPKDLLVGSRTIRVLSSTVPTAASRTIPPPHVDKFLNRSLQLMKSDPVPADAKKQTPSNKKKKDWERRSANLGVMGSRTGPARKFVRGSH